MRGKPPTIEPNQALEQAMLTFWEHGYTDTSLTKLEAAIGVGRQSIYNLFGDKKALFLKCYQHYLDTRLTSALALLKEGKTPHEQLHHFFHKSMDCTTDEHFGCFIGNTLAVPIADEAEIEKITKKAVNRFLSSLRATLTPLFPDKEEQTTMAWKFFTLFQGIQLIATQKKTRQNLLKVADQTINQLPQLT